MKTQLKIIAGVAIFLLAIFYMLFGPSDAGDHVALKGALVGAAIGSVVLAGKLLIRRRPRDADTKQNIKQDE